MIFLKKHFFFFFFLNIFSPPFYVLGVFLSICICVLSVVYVKHYESLN